MQQMSDDCLADTARAKKSMTSAAAPVYSGPQPFTDKHSRSHGSECRACTRLDTMLTVDAEELSTLRLCDAVPIWKEIRKQRERFRPRTHEATHGCFVALAKFFGEVRLKDITPGQLRAYQLARAANRIETAEGEVSPWKRRAGNSCINHEISALAQLLRHCGLWAPIQLYYSPLLIPAWSPREIPTEEEEERLFQDAALCNEARLAFLVACITANTSAAGCELRGLQLRNLFFREPRLNEKGIDMNPSEVEIPPEIVKNFNRPRKIPLNPEALSAFRECYRRALACGSTDPKHHLFPFRICRNRWDPTRPASRSWLRKSWAHLKRATELTKLNPHDMRHLFITRCFENDLETDTIVALAGHVDPRVTAYYSHQRRRKKYAAVMTISHKGPVSTSSVRDRSGTYS